MRHDIAIPIGNAGGGNRGRVLLVGPQEAPSGFTTITEALANALEGDTIFVQPGEYDENIVITTDYITLRAAQLGGYGRPDLAPTTGIALTVTAQGFVCKGIRFAATDDDAVLQEGNGFVYEDCVFDGDSGQAATDALLRLKGNDDDDSFTASEGLVENCLFRGSDGFAIAFQGAEAPGNGVGSTHCVIRGCRFIDNVAADLVTLDNSSTDATYSVQDVLIDRCQFMEPKNKATWIDFTTANGGDVSLQTGLLTDCYFNDDTVDTTAIKLTGTGVGVSGCHSLDGEFDGSGLD
jgi:hypothetical protein